MDMMQIQMIKYGYNNTRNISNDVRLINASEDEEECSKVVSFKEESVQILIAASDFDGDSLDLENEGGEHMIQNQIYSSTRHNGQQEISAIQNSMQQQQTSLRNRRNSPFKKSQFHNQRNHEEEQRGSSVSVH